MEVKIWLKTYDVLLKPVNTNVVENVKQKIFMLIIHKVKMQKIFHRHHVKHLN